MAGSVATSHWRAIIPNAHMLRSNEFFIRRRRMCKVRTMNSNLRAIMGPERRPVDSWAAATLPAAHAGGPAAVTVLFGSHTGNSERLARQIVERLAERGVRHTLIDMLECRKSHLQEARILLAVVSTHGNGEPPERAVPLFELLNGRKAPRLGHLRYAVLALGDSSYEQFCESGRQLDARLEFLGAERLQPRSDCDVDFELPARRWIEGLVERIGPAASAARIEPPAPAAARFEAGEADRPPATVANAHTRKNPFLAPLLANQRLTAAGSTKDVRHIELSLEGASLRYEPGDALGIIAHNRAADVQALLERLPFDRESPVDVDAQTTMPLHQALAQRYEIGPITSQFLRRYAQATGGAALAARLNGDALELARWVRARHLDDLVAEHPVGALDVAAFTSLLRPLAPRLYSIASSQRATPEEVHLTVGVVEYSALERRRRGMVSGHLAGLAGDDATVPVYLHRNPAFRLPADPAAAIIMIGPGTGIAPFRAFLAERAAHGASGRHWLFFGDRSFEADFLYQAEWLDWRKRGLLTRMDVAFSRDQPAKAYVQQRMIERGALLWRWLEEGAHLYVCGDAERMAADVQRALLEVIERHGGRSPQQAPGYLLELQRQRRYQRDVY